VTEAVTLGSIAKTPAGGNGKIVHPERSVAAGPCDDGNIAVPKYLGVFLPRVEVTEGVESNDEDQCGRRRSLNEYLVNRVDGVGSALAFNFYGGDAKTGVPLHGQLEHAQAICRRSQVGRRFVWGHSGKYESDFIQLTARTDFDGNT
jgi:hypothetical protein